jgi:hypothetical protein
MNSTLRKVDGEKDKCVIKNHCAGRLIINGFAPAVIPDRTKEVLHEKPLPEKPVNI